MSLWDGGAFDGPASDEPRTDPDPREAHGTPTETPEPVEAPAEQPSENDQPAAAAEAPETPETPETPAWEDFDAYLTHAQIDRSRAKVRVKVDGEEQQVALADVLKSYELAQAGHARMAENARDRETFAAEKRAAVEFFQQRAQQLEAWASAMMGQYLQPYEKAVSDAAASIAAGNDAYGYLSYAKQARDEARNWYASQLQQVAQARQQEALAQRQQAMQMESQRLLSARPEWKDAQRRDADHTRMRGYGASLGFKDAELTGISDHRQLLVLDTAARAAAAQQAVKTALGRDVSWDDLATMATEYGKLQASKPEVTKRVQAAPAMPKPGARTPPKDARSAALAQAKTAAKKSGYSDAATAAYLDQLEQMQLLS